MNKLTIEHGYSFLALLLPFGMYFLYCTFEDVSEINFYYFSFFFYFVLVQIILYFTIKKVDRIVIISERKNYYLVIYEVLQYVLIISFIFSMYYWIIYDFKKENFSNVVNGSGLEIFFDFYFYSITTFVMNNGSDIKPTAILSKFLVMTQIIISFTAVVIYLSNHQKIGNLFKHIEDRINTTDK